MGPSSQESASQCTPSPIVPKKLTPPNPHDHASSCSTTTSASIAQNPKSMSGYSVAQTTTTSVYPASLKSSSASFIPAQSLKQTLCSNSRIPRPQSNHQCPPRVPRPIENSKLSSSSALFSTPSPPTTPHTDMTKKTPQLPQAHYDSHAAVNEWQEIRSRRTKFVRPSNRKPLTDLVPSNPLNVSPSSPFIDTCVAVPINFHVMDKIHVPRRTKEEELVEACKENIAPGTGYIVVSPAKSVNSDIHVEITSILEEFKAGFNIKIEDIRRTIWEEYIQALRESERRILDRLGLFADLGVDILIRTLEDQVLDKMKEYTKASNDITHAHQADLFHATFASNLREDDIQQLRHLSQRNKANEIAHAASSAEGAKRRNEQFLRHLKKYGSSMEAETCQRFIDFVYGRTTVTKRRH